MWTKVDIFKFLKLTDLKVFYKLILEPIWIMNLFQNNWTGFIKIVSHIIIFLILDGFLQSCDHLPFSLNKLDFFFTHPEECCKYSPLILILYLRSIAGLKHPLYSFMLIHHRMLQYFFLSTFHIIFISSYKFLASTSTYILTSWLCLL